MEPVESNSTFQNAIKIYQEMAAEQQQLEKDLKAGNQKSAEQDIEKMQSLITDMNLQGHFHISTGSVYNDTIPMEEYLNQMEKEVQSGNFSTARNTDTYDVGACLTDLFQRLV